MTAVLDRAPTKPPPEPPEARRKRLRRERDRRHRQRLRDGKMTFQGEVDHVGINWLVKIHAVDPRDIDGRDPRAVRDAIGKGVSAMIKVSART